MDFMNHNYDDEYTYESRPGHKRGPMATAAIVLGVLSITLSSIIYVALPCGAIAVICAILSRDRNSMPGRSKAGMICGIIGMVATTVITVSAFRYVLTTDEGRSYLEYYYRIYTGDYDFELDETLEELFPFLYSSEDSENSGSDDSLNGDSDHSDGEDSGNYDNGSDNHSNDNGDFVNDSPGGSYDSRPNDTPDNAGEQPGGSAPQQNSPAEEGGFI
ncbi:MAG: hypothetical protein LUD16_10580 [Lachnospiraceae bacterium]|nr:hypothetical protein [Lachnospiraceae bacterium]